MKVVSSVALSVDSTFAEGEVFECSGKVLSAILSKGTYEAKALAGEALAGLSWLGRPLPWRGMASCKVEMDWMVFVWYRNGSRGGGFEIDEPLVVRMHRCIEIPLMSD